MQRDLRGVVVDVADLSDPGRDPAKQVNEDSTAYAASTHGHLVVVCDGMGGHAGGREASEAAVRAIVAEVDRAPPGTVAGPLLVAAVEAAGRAVFAVGGDQPAELRPGSTCVAALIHEGGAEIAHVGDSRMYLVRDAQAHRVTRDHSMVQQMVDAGVLTPEEAAVHPEANKITRALGMRAEVEVELRPAALALRPDDVLVLATDGLTDLVSDAEIGPIVAERIAGGPELVCRALVDLANERGGYDNITVHVVRVVQTPHRDDDPTIVDEPPPGTVPFGGRPGPTFVDAPGAHPAPTLLDEPARVERTTEPGAMPRLPATEPPEAMPAHRSQSGRLYVVGAAIVAGLIVVAVVAWWLSGAFKPTHDDADVPPPPPEPARSAAQPVTVLQPEPTPPEPRHDHPHRRDAGAERDAGMDASPDATTAIPAVDP